MKAVFHWHGKLKVQGIVWLLVIFLTGTTDHLNAIHVPYFFGTLPHQPSEFQSPPPTAIKISTPNSNTIWNVSDPVEIVWDTKNIPFDKTIKFYLVKDDMVVQELGIFENKRFADGIQLNKSLQTGDNYRVMGIELFPNDTKSIAKFATSFFTIKGLSRKPRPAESKVVEKNAIRHTFDGREISYVEKLEVSSETIQINIWDHGRKDDDIVSIYLNGEAVVYKYFLDYHKKGFEIKLDPTRPNDLFLYAHNLGKYPPNTVSIEIVDGDASENIILNSDLKSCEAVLINVKE